MNICTFVRFTYSRLFNIRISMFFNHLAIHTWLEWLFYSIPCTSWRIFNCLFYNTHFIHTVFPYGFTVEIILKKILALMIVLSPPKRQPLFHFCANFYLMRRRELMLMAGHCLFQIWEKALKIIFHLTHLKSLPM